MGSVMTVLGAIDSKHLGNTSMHDHILVDTSFYKDQYKSVIPHISEDKLTVKCENMYYLRKGYFGISKDSLRLDDVDLAIKEVNYFKNSGGSTILEVSPAGIRGKIQDIKRVSENTGVNVIVSTGFYGYGSWPEECVDMSIDELQAYIEKEIYEGIDGTNIKAGSIKIACNFLNRQEKKALKAGIRASKKTGLPLTVHTGLGMTIKDTLKMADIAVNKEGMDPQRLIMCHIDGFITKSLKIKDYILNYENATQQLLNPVKKILNMGANISFDTFGSLWTTEILGTYRINDYDRIRGLLPLIKKGYSKQIVLGSDLFLKISYRRYSGNGYTRILDFVIPMLKKLGVSQKDINNMMINNPARLLSC
ncbi:MAG: hypothetical protein MJA31_07185 [Clostridia bacterium]|nr:hypothetical protein [Clostridia bacterium]